MIQQVLLCIILAYMVYKYKINIQNNIQSQYNNIINQETNHLLQSNRIKNQILKNLQKNYQNLIKKSYMHKVQIEKIHRDLITKTKRYSLLRLHYQKNKEKLLDNKFQIFQKQLKEVYYEIVNSLNTGLKYDVLKKNILKSYNFQVAE